MWTAFRWVSNLLYGLCWIVALPLELFFNRRVGRRYAGVIPVACSSIVLTAVMLAPALLEAYRTPQTASEFDLASLWPVAIVLGLFALCVLRQRLASWWRFRSNEQVHSFSNGVPCWLNLPQWFVKASPSIKLIDVSPTRPAMPIPRSPAEALRQEASALLGTELRGFMFSWIEGQVPRGPIMWIASTVVHPLALIVLGVYFMPYHPLGTYVAVGGLAVFVKARIQKAFVVETVYDLFDARIEQTFLRELSEPQPFHAAERAGLVVPGVARMMAGTFASPMPDPQGGAAIEVKPPLTRPPESASANGTGSSRFDTDGTDRTESESTSAGPFN
ncbi:MAG: hypothetical protein JSR77_05740 [Planctomycetes bacterium]|nr:hypothetical protein [Planctomycetota bacterium]